MADNENKNEPGLFGEDTVKPLFGAEDDSIPSGKPLFDHDFSDPGDAAFVKPLFDEPEASAEEEPVDLEEFQEYDALPEEETEEYVLEEESVEIAEDPAEESLPELETEEEPPAEEIPEPQAEETAPVFAEEPVPEEPVQEEPVTPARPRGTVVLSGDLEAMSLGALMAYARETAGISEDDVFQVTKINGRFLRAIESDQFDQLPSGAFPGAYVRALCSYYHLEKSASEIAQKKAAAYCTECTPPDDVYERLPEYAVINKEEQEKFRRIMIITGIFFLAMILLTVAMVMMFSSGSSTPDSAPAESPVKMESLEKLSAPPQMSPVETLTVPGK